VEKQEQKSNVLTSDKYRQRLKAPNFRLHGNSGALFQKGLLSLKRVLQKNEQNKSCRKTLDLQIWFCSLLSKVAKELARKSQKFR
jgi:hypothetical protein